MSESNSWRPGAMDQSSASIVFSYSPFKRLVLMMNSYMGFMGPVSLVKVFHIMVTWAPGGTLLTFNRGSTGTCGAMVAVGVGLGVAVGVGGGVGGGVGRAVAAGVGRGVGAGVAGIAVGVIAGGAVGATVGGGAGAAVGAGVGWGVSSGSSSPQATMTSVNINAATSSAYPKRLNVCFFLISTSLHSFEFAIMDQDSPFEFQTIFLPSSYTRGPLWVPG